MNTCQLVGVQQTRSIISVKGRAAELKVKMAKKT